MANPKSITIKLTDKQRRALRGLTGEDHSEVKFEAVNALGTTLATRSPLAKKHAMRRALTHANLESKAPLAKKHAMRRALTHANLESKAPLAKKHAMRRALTHANLSKKF